ncbi:DUF1178 family protein [Aestuariivita sp.]|jgi:hypothetical protein|uniref:DUF1178 family protein n=1 Tax=Aestuariivita sp. TaxID=1872407 RepID=UPI00216ECFCF|nr:DUF1178 family protein [Aestuariivita sp.]MCE8009138.1 DUF1178 family protein [Aestuariivita sp.]
MIQYALKCTDGHRFDSWFQSAEAFDKLARAGMVVCATCGTTEVSKSVMAPRVRPGRKAAPVPVPKDGAGSLSTPATPQEQAMAQLKQHIEQNSDYVGTSFATEARKMYDGEAPERPIHGEAKPEEARKLIEDGVPVAPLPFRLTRKTN